MEEPIERKQVTGSTAGIISIEAFAFGLFNHLQPDILRFFNPVYFLL
jgi:hypothetical protein